MTDNDTKRGKAIGAAWHLHEFLLANCGQTKDWPVQITCDDPEKAAELRRLLNDMQEALESLKR